MAMKLERKLELMKRYDFHGFGNQPFLIRQAAFGIYFGGIDEEDGEERLKNIHEAYIDDGELVHHY